MLDIQQLFGVEEDKRQIDVQIPGALAVEKDLELSHSKVFDSP